MFLDDDVVCMPTSRCHDNTLAPKIKQILSIPRGPEYCRSFGVIFATTPADRRLMDGVLVYAWNVDRPVKNEMFLYNWKITSKGSD